MIKRLKLDNVGPAPEMELDFARRLNLVTGDNGLGKSFLLDVVWWALTGRWPKEVNRRMTSGHPARPRDAAVSAMISAALLGRTGFAPFSAFYERRDQRWKRNAGAPRNSGDCGVCARGRLVFRLGPRPKLLESTG